MDSRPRKTLRPLALHFSALSPEEYLILLGWLKDLLPPSSVRPGAAASKEDDMLLTEPIRVDDVGRFLLETLHISEEIWEDILALFHPSHRTIQPRHSASQSHLRALPPLKGSEVLAVFRLVGHAQLGKPVHIEGATLAFRQCPPASPDEQGSTFRSTQPNKSQTKPIPPPQHLSRRPSASSNITSSPSHLRHQSRDALGPSASGGAPPLPLSRKPSNPQHPPSVLSRETPTPPTPPPAPPPPANPNPFRRASQAGGANPLQRVASRTSEGDSLRKVREVALDSSSEAGSADEDQEELLGNVVISDRVRRWQEAPGGGGSKDDDSEKHSEGGPSSWGTRKDGHNMSSIAGLGFASSNAPSSSTKPNVPMTIAVPGAPGTVSSNPFRSRLASNPTVPLSISGEASPLSPPLPPRPMQSAKPPLPPRDPAASSSRSDSPTLHSPAKAAFKPASAPPVKPPKPSAFHTTPLIHQSLAAAKDARKDASANPVNYHSFEVIGSSTSSGSREGSVRSLRRDHADGDGSRSGSAGASTRRFSAINASIAAGLAGGTRKQRSHSLLSAASSSGSQMTSPSSELGGGQGGGAVAVKDYPFPRKDLSSRPPPPARPSPKSFTPDHSSSTDAMDERQPLSTFLPPPPQRRNSVQATSSLPSSASSTTLGRASTFSSTTRHGSAKTKSSSGLSSKLDGHHHRSESVRETLAVVSQVAGDGVGWLKGAAAGGWSTSSGTSGAAGRRRGERGRLVESEDEEDHDSDSEGGVESDEDRRREMRRLNTRADQDEWRRLGS